MAGQGSSESSEAAAPPAAGSAPRARRVSFEDGLLECAAGESVEPKDLRFVYGAVLNSITFC